MQLFILSQCLLLCSAISLIAQSSTTNPVGFQNGLHFFKNSAELTNKVQNVATPSLIEVFYGVYDASINSFNSYWPNSYGSLPPNENPYPLTLTIESGEGILVGTVHPYHPALMTSNQAEGNPTQPNSWYGIPSGNQKLGIMFRLTESNSNTQNIFESIVLPSENSVGFFASTDSAPLGQIFQQDSGISIVLVPEPRSIALFLTAFASMVIYFIPRLFFKSQRLSN
jgi:hypothetical protein